MTPPGRVSSRLPQFPWDRLVAHRHRAASHPDGLVDLSVGTPVDEVPLLVREALAAGADAPGYPATAGTSALREAAVDWLARRCGVRGLSPMRCCRQSGSRSSWPAWPCTSVSGLATW